MAKSRTYKEADPKKLDHLKKLHEKNASLKAKQDKARDAALKANEELKKVVAERHALADEITAYRGELIAARYDPAEVTAACCTPDSGGKSKKE